MNKQSQPGFPGKIWQRIKNMDGFSISLVIVSVGTGVTALVFMLRILFSFSAPAFTGREYNNGIPIPVVFSRQTGSDTGVQISEKAILNNNSSQGNLTKLEFDTGTAYLKPHDFGNRIILLLPEVLFYLLLCYCSWQMAVFVDNISRNRMFLLQNYQLLSNIAQAMLIYQCVVLVMHKLGKYFPITVSDPLILTAVPDYHFSWIYAIAASIIFIIAKAFQRGYLLQKEQDLTI
jgi:hypothetical protein